MQVCRQGPIIVQWPLLLFFFTCSKPIVHISSNIFCIIGELEGIGWSSAHYFNQATAFSNIQIGWWKRRIILCANKDWHNLPGVLFHYCQSNFIFLLNTNKADSPLLDGLCTFPLLHPLFLRLRTYSFFYVFFKLNLIVGVMSYVFVFIMHHGPLPGSSEGYTLKSKGELLIKDICILKIYMLKYFSDGQRQQHSK